CLVAFAIAGMPGAGSAAVGGAAGLAFPIVTAVAAVTPERRYGTRPYAPAALFAFLVASIVQAAVFPVALSLLLHVAPIVPGAVYGALVAAVIGSLVVDVIFANGIRPMRESS